MHTSMLKDRGQEKVLFSLETQVPALIVLMILSLTLGEVVEEDNGCSEISRSLSAKRTALNA